MSNDVTGEARRLLDLPWESVMAAIHKLEEDVFWLYVDIAAHRVGREKGVFKIRAREVALRSLWDQRRRLLATKSAKTMPWKKGTALPLSIVRVENGTKT